MPSLGKQIRACPLLVFRKGPLLEWWQHLQMTWGFCLHVAFKWPANDVKCSQAWHLKHSVLGIWITSLSVVWPRIQLTPGDVAGSEHNCRPGEHLAFCWSQGQKCLVLYDHSPMSFSSKSVIVILGWNSLLPGPAESREVWRDHQCIYIQSHILWFRFMHKKEAQDFKYYISSYLRWTKPVVLLGDARILT